MIRDRTSIHMTQKVLKSLLSGLLAGTEICLGAPVTAQNITLDGSLGPVRDLGNGPVYEIQQADGTTVGENLFHSFGQFNLSVGEKASFQSTPTIQNILTRVTGGSTSSIDGLIFTESPAVNFFLINPSGIIFGPNAQLDIGGTTRGDFTATTLDALVWSDDNRFDAVNPDGAEALLKIVGDPSGFLGSQRRMAEIALEGSFLQVYKNQDLRFLGGGINVDGALLIAPSGRVGLGSTNNLGTVSINQNGSFQFTDQFERGDVQFNNGALVDVTSEDKGDIQVIGKDINVLEGSILRAGIARNLGTDFSQAGDIKVDATGTVSVTGNFSQVVNDVRTGASGKGGNIEIIARNLIVQGNGSRLSTILFGTGVAGNVQIKTRDLVLLQGSTNGQFPVGITSSVETLGEGKGGNVIIETSELKVIDTAQIDASTNGQGDAGNIFINARDQVLFKDNSTAFSLVGKDGEGKGGGITINTGALEVRDGSQLVASTLGVGNAGNIFINTIDSTEPMKTGHVLFQNGDAFSNVGETGSGSGGNIVINTTELEVRNGAQLIASTEGIGNAGNILINARDFVIFEGRTIDGRFGSDAFSSVEKTGIGKGGDIVINTNILEVKNGAQLTAETKGQGNAGNIKLIVRDRVLFEGSNTAALSNVNSIGNGNGGDIIIVTGTLEILRGAQLIATTQGEGDAGNISLAVRDRLRIEGTDPIQGFSSGILTSNANPNPSKSIRSGGDISITTPQLQITNGAVIDSRTVNDGPGGDITLNVDDLTLIDGGQLLSTSDGSGPAGTVRINATNALRITGSDPIYTDRRAQFGSAVASISANSGIYVRSTDTGAAGQVIIGDPNLGTLPRLLLLDDGEIVADSNAVTGGDISLNLAQSLVMRNNSLISATAGRSEGGGDGGNITISVPFVLSLPDENSDIIANAFSGTGGNITINADAILNFSLNEDKKSFEQLRQQSTNDISASSQFGSNGTLNLAGLNVDPTRGISQLPSTVSSTQPSQGCQTASTGQATSAEFFTTGRGGLPPSPSDALSSNTILDDLRVPSEFAVTEVIPTAASTSRPITEATHWEINAQGKVMLAAQTAAPAKVNHCKLLSQD